MNHDVITMLEQMASNGHAPISGCSRFGFGYDDAFNRLKEQYLRRAFERGRSSEKFVIGPFGSGKTHFLRQLAEIARAEDCVTAEVALNKDVDFTQSLMVYREVARELRVPNQEGQGIANLLEACLEKVRQQAPTEAVADPLVSTWISGLSKGSFKLELFGRIAQRGLEASHRGDRPTFDVCCRWLEGEVTDRNIAKELVVSPVPKSEQNLHGRRALLSLFQLARRAHFRGTLLAFDEAEQGLRGNKAKRERILSMLQSGINAMADLEDGAALIVFALTPDLVEEMDRFMALQQRVSDPGVGHGFFDGNTFAPQIDLTKRKDPVGELREIGSRLVELLYNQENSMVSVPKEVTLAAVARLAQSVYDEDASSQDRRMMVKRACTLLVRLNAENRLLEFADIPRDNSTPDDEV